MTVTLAIRLAEDDRDTLAAAAQARGQGVSTLLRQLAEAEALRLRREAIRAESARVAAAIRASPEARAEFETLAGDTSSWPAWDDPLPKAWQSGMDAEGQE